MADELSVEDILAIEHDVIPLDGADVFQGSSQNLFQCQFQKYLRM